MVNYNDGKIHGWNGGECPVHPYTEVQYWLRCGSVEEEEAGELEWKHRSGSKTFDIVAFQVIKEYKEPKTIWVNDYRTGPLAYYAKEDAEKAAGRSVIRKAVKYQEVQE